MADGSGWINDYAGVALGSATSPNPGIGNNANANVGEVGSEYRVFAGHEFTQNFGIETQYNHYHGFGGNVADGSAHSFDLLGTGTYYFDRANTIGLVGKAGFNYATVGSYGLTNGGLAGSMARDCVTMFPVSLIFVPTTNVISWAMPTTISAMLKTPTPLVLLTTSKL